MDPMTTMTLQTARATLDHWLQTQGIDGAVLHAWQTLTSQLDGERTTGAGPDGEVPTGPIFNVWTRIGGPNSPVGQGAPVLRVTPYESPRRSGRHLALAADQRGTLLESAIDELDAAPVPTADVLMRDLATPRWLADALTAALRRDPVKAAAESGVLARVLARRADEQLQNASSDLEERRATC